MKKIGNGFLKLSTMIFDAWACGVGALICFIGAGIIQWGYQEFKDDFFIK